MAFGKTGKINAFLEVEADFLLALLLGRVAAVEWPTCARSKLILQQYTAFYFD